MPIYTVATVTTMTLAAGCNHISMLVHERDSLLPTVCNFCCKIFQLLLWWKQERADTISLYLLLDCSN